MLKICTLLIMGLFAISCNSQNSLLQKKDFTKKYFDSLSNRFPDVNFTILDDSTIESTYQGNDVRHSIDNTFKEYLAEPDSIQGILHKRILVAVELYGTREDIQETKIIPIIKPVEFLEDIKNVANKMGAKKEVEGVYEKYNDQLIIVYAEDAKNSIRYLTNDDLRTLSISKDSIKAIAIKNLSNLLANIQRDGSNGTYMLTAGGNYEASIILLNNIFSKESLPVNGNFVIAIPNRGMLLITGSNDKEGIEKIKELSKKLFETGSYQVSEYLYKWNGKIFEKYN